MLQRDHDEIKQQLNDLKNSQKNNNDLKESAVVATTNHHPTQNSKLNDIHLMNDTVYNELSQKLQESHRRIETLNMEIQR